MKYLNKYMNYMAVFLSTFAICYISLLTPVLANPQGGQVVSGAATIQQTTNTTTINQSSKNIIINWQNFNIGQHQATHFQQPTGGIALNRINATQGASQIYGLLTANGQIILINAAGIFFGPSAVVNVGGMIASTANISNRNFLTKNYVFSNPSGYAGSIINQGQIIAANHGLIALMGTAVENDGSIQANLGHLVLASGKQFTINFSGNDLVNFTINQPSTHPGVDQHGHPLKNGVNNTGTLIADGGQILVTAASAEGVLDNVINMQGVAEAKSFGSHNGEIILMGTGGIVKVSGTLNASGKKHNQTGGDIEILGPQVALTDNAYIDVSGDAGGGKILIGGNAHGAGPELNATNTYVGPNVTLNASALTNGNGGNVVVWSDSTTQFYGNILATGGTQSGNGGWVEVSSKANLDFEGLVNTFSPLGMIGTLLLDPEFLIVQAVGGSTYSAGMNNLFANDIGLTNIITPASLVALTTNIILQANTDVIFNDALNLVNAGVSLVVDAGRSILVNANISTNNGSITMLANDSAAIAADRLTPAVDNPVGDNESLVGNITLAAGVSINSGTATTSLSIDPSTTAPFNPGSITLNSGSLLLGTGTVSLIANNMFFDTSATPAHIGGTNAGTGNAATVIIAPSTATSTIGIAGGVGTLQLTQAELDDIYATNVHIGSNTAGNIVIGAWTPAATFAANGVLTLDTGATISESGIINLATNNASLLLRDATAVNLATFANVFSNVASATLPGSLSVLEAGNNNLTIASLTDDVGTATGLSTTGGNAITVSENAGTGNVNVNNNVTSSSGVIGITAGTDVLLNAGNIITTGSINLTGKNGTISETATGLISGGLLTTNSVGGLLLNNNNTITGFHASNTTSGMIALINASALNISGITQTGTNINVVSDASLTTSGNLTTTGGNVNLQAETSLTLANSINAAAGIVTLNANVGGTGANNFNMDSGNSAIITTNTNANAVVIDVNTLAGGTGTANLGNITTGAGATITVATNNGGNTTGGSITQNAGTLLNVGTAGAINLNTGAAAAGIGTNAANILTETGTITASTGTGGLYITNNEALVLGPIKSNGAFSLTAGGSITQSAPLLVTGTSTFAVTTPLSDITLTNPANNFAALMFDGTTANLRNLTLTSINANAALPASLLSAINLENVTINFSNAAIALPEMTLTNGGNLNVTGGGDVTEQGQLVVTGTTTINAGAYSINLSTLNNDFIGAVSLFNSGANNVSVVGNTALILGNVMVGSGTLTLTSTGIISQQAGTAVTQAVGAGLATFTALDGLTLGNAGNIIDDISISNLVSGNVTLTNTASPLTIAGITTAGGGNINVNNTGDIIANGTIATTANGSVTLTATGVETLGGTIQTNGSGGVNLTGSTINLGANITTSGGNILFNNPVTLTSSPIINAGNGNITFANTLNGAFAPTLTSAGTLTFGGLVGNVTPLASLTTTNTAPGVTDINANITTAGSQNYGNPITLSGNSVLTVNNANTNITIGNGVNWAGAFALTLNAPGTNSNIAINGAMNGGNGTLNLFAPTSTIANITTGTNGSINVGNFNLENGFWSQVGTLPGFFANNFEINSGTIPANNVTFLRVAGGTGTAVSPYQLTDVYGLQGIDSNTTLLALNYQLNNNISAGGTINWNSGAGFIPIGSASNPFNGNFLGQNHSITGLVINSAAANAIGLFGEISNTTTISMLNLVNAAITSTLAGAMNIGTLIGENNGGSLLGSNATGSLTTGNNTTNVGGLVGNNLGTIAAGTPQQASYTMVTITTGTTSQNIGGLVGTNGGLGGNVSIAYSAGNIIAGNGSSNIGGLVGNEDSTYLLTAPIQNTYSISTIAATAATNVGGLVGNQSAGAILTSYSSGIVPTTGTNVGGFIGNTSIATNLNNFFDTTSSGTGIGVGAGSNAGVTPGCFSGNCPNGGTGTSLSATNTFANATWNIVSGPSATSTPPNGIWYILPGETRPMLAAEWSTNVVTPHQLELMNFALGANYTLVNSINLSNVSSNPADVWGGNANPAGFMPIGNATTNFTGTFNGNNNTISNLTINLGAINDVGLFGAISASALVNHVNLTGVNITSGGSNVGALVGLNNGGTILNVSSTGTLTSNGNGVSDIGGLVGQNNLGIVSAAVGTFSFSKVAVISSGNNVSNIGGLIGQSIGNGNVSVSYAYSAGSVLSTGNTVSNIGGLIGDNQGGVSLTYSSDPITATGISVANVGGLIGNNEGANGFVNTSYADGTISVTNAGSTASDVGGLVGSENSTYTTNPPIQNTYSMSAINLAGAGVDVGGLVGNQINGAISDSYSTGQSTIAGTKTNVGGFIGNAAVTTNSNNFFDMDTSGTNTAVGNGSANGVTPESTQIMTTENTFTNAGWNFATIWGILGDNQSYPYLLGLQLGVEVIDTAANNLIPTAATIGNVITPVQVTNPGNAGTYYYLFNQADLSPGNPILFYNSALGGSVVGNGLVMPATTGMNIAPIVLTISANTIEVGGSNTATFTSNNLGSSSVGGDDVLFSGGLTLGNATNRNVTLQTSATTTFDINSGVNSAGPMDNMLFNSPVILNNNGAAISTSGTQTYNAPVTLLSAANLVTSTANGAVIITGNITGGTSNLTVNNVDNNSSISGVYSGSGGLTKQGVGTLSLPNTNAYTGGTTLTGGTLLVNANGALGTGTINFNGGTLAGGPAMVTLPNPYATAGTSTISTIGGMNSLTLSGAGNLGTDYTLDITNSATTTLTGNISGAGSLNEIGGTLSIASPNNSTYSGVTTISNNGLLEIATATNALGTGTLFLNSGNLESTVIPASTTAVLNNGITVNGASSITGTEAITLTTPMTLYSGDLNINSTATTTLAGLALGAGSMSISNGIVSVAGNNTSYLGATTLNSGVLQINSLTNALGTGTGNSLILNGGTLIATMNGASLVNKFLVSGNATIGGVDSLTMIGNGTLSNTLNITNTAGTIALSGSLGGTGSIIENGMNGVLALSGSNTYTGNNTITAGTAIVSNDQGLGLNNTTTINPNGIVEVLGANLVKTEGFALNNSLLEGTANGSTQPSVAGPITLLANTTMNMITTLTASDIFTLSGAMNGTTALDNGDLTLSGPGTINLSGVIGGTTAINTLTVDNTLKTLVLNTTGITSVGDQIYNAPITLTANPTLKTTGTGGDITFAAAVTGGNHNLTLNAAGSISQTNGSAITTTGTVTTTSRTGTILDNANYISAFNATDASPVGISLINNSNLTITGMRETGSGDITVNNIGSITDNGAINTLNNVALTSTSSIDQNGAGAITAALLTLNSVTGDILNGANAVANFNLVNSTSGNIALTNNVALNITGISQHGSGSTTVINNAALNVDGVITNGTGPITLSATGLLTDNQNITATNAAISLQGVGLIESANTTVSAGSGNITANARTGTLTLNADSLLQSTGIVNLIGDMMSFDTSVTPAQIGGTGIGTGNAATVILQPSTAGNTIGIAGGIGTLQLTAAMLNDVFGTNVRIGSPVAGNIDSAAWTAGGNFAPNGVLTLDTNAAITQSGAINLGTNNTSLLLRANNVTLNSNNIFNEIAGSVTNAMSVTSAGNSALTVSSLNDDLGNVNGIISTYGRVTLDATNAGIVLNAPISAANTYGDAIVVAGTSFTNNIGPAVFTTGIGNFLVWSQNTPGDDKLNGLVYNFIQYDAFYNVTPVLGTGNGLLYTAAPVITPTLIGTVTKVYDANNIATLTDNNYSFSGAIDGDTVTISHPTTGTYASPNVGNNINVSVTGITATITDGNILVYGYQLISTAINNIGFITPAILTVQGILANNKNFDGNTTATLNSSAAILNGIFAGDVVNLDVGHYIANFASSAVGNNIAVTAYNLGLTGISANNYRLIQPSGLFANILAYTPVTPPIVVPPGAVSPTNYGPGSQINISSIINGITNNLAGSNLGGILTIQIPTLFTTPLVPVQPIVEQRYGSGLMNEQIRDTDIKNRKLLSLLALLGLPLFFIFPGRKNEIQIISFKMRTALESIMGFSRMMYDGEFGPVSPQEKLYLENILTGAEDILVKLKIIETNNVVLNRESLNKMVFEMRTALNNVMGFTEVMSILPITIDQANYLNDVLLESNRILQLLPKKYRLVAA